MTDSLICDINHPLFDVINNPTRRQMLRLIACEHNYGNRIANILNISTPAVHRQLKNLLDEEKKSISIISERSKTRETYSGKKGAEATLYEIDAKIGLFFTIFPNFIHSQIIDYDQEQSDKYSSRQMDVHPELKGLEPPINPEDKKMKRFYDIYQCVQKHNAKIVELQNKLMDILSIKDEFMGEVDEIVKSCPELSYEDRVILRAITCLGPDCSSDLSHLLKLDESIILNHVKQLKTNNWLK